MIATYVAVAAVGFGALAIVTLCNVAAALRRGTIAASGQAYQSSKWAFLAILAVIAALFFLHVISTYLGMVALFLLDLVFWRAIAIYALGRRDTLAGDSTLA